MIISKMHFVEMEFYMHTKNFINYIYIYIATLRIENVRVKYLKQKEMDAAMTPWLHSIF
jgi:hypothetical protein